MCDRQFLCLSQSTETCRCVTDSTGTVRLTAARQAPTATVSSASVDRDWRRETSSSPATRSVLPASASRRVSSPPKPALQALQVRANAQVLLHDMACRYNCTMLIIFMFLTLCNVFYPSNFAVAPDGGAKQYCEGECPASCQETLDSTSNCYRCDCDFKPELGDVVIPVSSACPDGLNEGRRWTNTKVCLGQGEYRMPSLS